MKEKSELAIKLKELRKKAGVTAKEVSDAIGIKDSRYRRYEIDTNPKKEIYISLANYFNVSVDYLIGNSTLRETFKFADSSSEYSVSEIDIKDLSETEKLVIAKLRSISSSDFEDVIKYLDSKKQ